MKPLMVLACFALSVCCVGPAAAEKPATAGKTARGFLLPNGWYLAPAGRHVVLTDLPLNIIPLADNRHALVATSGYNAHELSLVDLNEERVVARGTVNESWFGLGVSPDESRVWWAGGGSNRLYPFALTNGKLVPQITPPPKKIAEKKRKNADPHAIQPFKSGLYFDSPSQTLYSLDINAGTIEALDGQTAKTLRKGSCGGRPYDVILSRNRALLYVSDWAGRVVLSIRPDDLRVVERIAVGEHPNQLVLHPKDDRLFVACASTNNVSVIDTRLGRVVETIYTPLFPKSPEGSTPDALAVAPDGSTLYVANADNNCVAVIDVQAPNRSQVKGFIPTGWYPTSVAVTRDGKRLLVGVGKGLDSKANPIPKAKGVADRTAQTPQSVSGPRLSSPNAHPPAKMTLPTNLRRYPYIGETMSGALSIVPIPDARGLAAYTAQVYANCPYSDALLSRAPASGHKTIIPSKVGDPCPIKHVIYIIKENRTYDQVFGDLPQGNGDPSLVMFGEQVSPNHHKLAREFVLLDNLYCNGQVSRDGHPWSTMAYNTDYIARDWHLTYSTAKNGVDDDDEGNLSKAPSGYLWDACLRNGLTYRSYAEYGRRVSEPDGRFRMDAGVPGLVGHVCPDFGFSQKKDHKQRDTEDVDIFLREFHQFERDGNLPRFIVMSLGEDHTTGTKPGTFTPQACVASNDVALGRLVEAVTHSKLWPQIAIFVIEDDAQNGPDHVDAQRTVGFVISPYTRRKFVDSTQYSTVSLVRTIELILGLPPLSQFDAAARPMFASFTDRLDLTPYVHEPARIDVNAINPPKAYGAARSAKMDFSEYDRIDDFELNEILWRAIKGVDAPIPPPVRRAIADRPANLN